MTEEEKTRYKRINYDCIKLVERAKVMIEGKESRPLLNETPTTFALIRIRHLTYI